MNEKTLKNVVRVRCKELFDKEEALNKQLDEVEKQLGSIRKLYNVCGWASKDLLLGSIIDKELQISSLNLGNIKEDVKTDLTIGTIDSSFDPYKFIEETVSKYLNS